MNFNNNLDEGLDENGFIASPADYIFGLGNKAKKAEKKLKKVDKALKQGNIKKAERKLDKAEKKISKTADPLNVSLTTKLMAGQASIDEQKAKQDQLAQLRNPAISITNQANNSEAPTLEALDPIAQGAGASIPGSGSLNAPGGGGELSGEELASSASPDETPQLEVTNETNETGNETSKSKNIGLIVIVALALVLAYFYFKKRKK